MVDNNSLGFLVSDNEENLIIYMYQPESRESFGGQKCKFNDDVKNYFIIFPTLKEQIILKIFRLNLTGNYYNNYNISNNLIRRLTFLRSKV